MKRPDVTIALLTWNRKRYLEKGLPSLFANLSKSLSHEILIMDNASGDGTLAELRKYECHPEVRIIANGKNCGFRGYNRLFGMARGRVIVELDDDVIEFPKDFDRKLLECLDAYDDYGFISLDTIRNDKTDGGRPNPGVGRMDRRKGMEIEEGDARGYCAAFRRHDYRLIRPFTFFFRFSLRHPQDYVVSGLMRCLLKRRSGVLVGEKCLHANGPLYAREFGRTELDRMKMIEGGCPDRLSAYEVARKGGRPYSP